MHGWTRGPGALACSNASYPVSPCCAPTDGRGSVRRRGRRRARRDPRAQGMAYAELAGLPAVTGLYTTIACLVGYALFGPSRVLVLGPDSSVSPLILAAITPLSAADDPSRRSPSPGMLAVIVGLIEIGLGVGKLGFVADLLSKEVQVGYMNGLASRSSSASSRSCAASRPTPTASSTRCRAFVEGFDERNATALAVGLATLAVLLVLPRVITQGAGGARRRRRGDRRHRRVRPRHRRRSVPSPRGCPRPTCRGPADDVGPLLIAAVGITLVSLTDTIATSTSFAARRGDEVDPNQEMIGIGRRQHGGRRLPGLRRVDERFAAPRSPSSPGAKSQLTGLVGAVVVALLLLFLQRAARRSAPDRAGRGGHRAALSLADLDALRRYCPGPQNVVGALARRHRRRRLLRRPGGHRHRRRAVDPAVLPAELVAPRRGARPGRRRRGLAQLRGDRRRAQRPDVVVYRWEAPLFFANAGMFRQQVRHHVRQHQPRWMVLSARRSPTSTSPRRTCSSGSTSS